jgi:hypothetical protein
MRNYLREEDFDMSAEEPGFIARGGLVLLTLAAMLALLVLMFFLA